MAAKLRVAAAGTAVAAISAVPVSRGVLVVVEPVLLDLVQRYLHHPRKRQAIAIELASRRVSPPSGPERTVEVAAGIGARLDAVVRAYAHARLTASAAETGAYGAGLFREVAWLAANSGATFDQGPGRWLGLLGHPDSFLPDAPAEVRHLSRALRFLVQSSANLTPDLALEGWETMLPASGGAGRASGAVSLEFMGWLELLLTNEAWPLRPLAMAIFGADGVEGWRRVVLRASRSAQRRGGHLLELDASVLRARATPPRERISDIRELFPSHSEVRVA